MASLIQTLHVDVSSPAVAGWGGGGGGAVSASCEGWSAPTAERWGSPSGGGRRVEGDACLVTIIASSLPCSFYSRGVCRFVRFALPSSDGSVHPVRVFTFDFTGFVFLKQSRWFSVTMTMTLSADSPGWNKLNASAADERNSSRFWFTKTFSTGPTVAVAFFSSPTSTYKNGSTESWGKSPRTRNFRGISISSAGLQPASRTTSGTGRNSCLVLRHRLPLWLPLQLQFQLQLPLRSQTIQRPPIHLAAALLHGPKSPSVVPPQSDSRRKLLTT